MAMNEKKETTQRILRIADVAADSDAMHTPIIDYDKIPTVSYADTPIVSLEKAVEPLVSLMPAIQSKATVAKRNCKNSSADGLTLDESASIRLYSMAWNPRNKCLYVVLNKTLREKNKEKLKLWFLYLKLFLTALERLPPKNRTVYRGVKLDLQKEYSKGDTVVWWAFSSSTASIGVLKQDLFLGQSGDRTMFAIECAVGKDIQKHSSISGEDEILLLAGSQFKVLDSLNQGHGLHIIQLEQIKHGERLLEQILHSTAMNLLPAEATSLDSMHNQHPAVIQTFVLNWLDSNIDESKDEYRESIAKLRQIVNNINIFTDANQCMQFLKNINEEKAFLIISGALGEHLISNIHQMSQINAIFVFCGNKSRHEKWAKHWSKIEGVFIDINSICECIKQAAQKVNQDSITITIMASDEISKKNLDQLDSTFMYTQILKDILLQIDFEQKHLQEFVEYCRHLFVDNISELKNIDKFEKEYHDHSPIWWYTCGFFLYRMVNNALRKMNFDVLIKVGFFICDLHRQIERLCSEQFDVHHHKQSSFIVYRSEWLSVNGFDQLKKTKGGLIAFNSFLSTTSQRDVSLQFVHHASEDIDSIGILFQMDIDPSIVSTPFAFISDFSCFPDDEEILFSMHSVFRIGEINQIDGRLYQVNLTLTSDQDPELRALTKCIREEIEGPTGWHRLGNLLLKLGQFNDAKQLYEVMLNQTTDQSEKTLLYNQLGLVKNATGSYKEALIFYEKSLEIRQRTLPVNHPDLGKSYNNIGSVYDKMGEYSKALSIHEKALEIRERTLPPNHPDRAQSYSNIGLIYDKMGEFSKALSFQEKAIEIRQKTLPDDHPDLGESYNNIGSVYDKMGEYSKAVSFQEKALEIRKKTLPANHPDLGESHNNIGSVYDKMGEYSKALSFQEKAFEIRQKTLPANHPDLAQSYNNIGLIYDKMGEYSKALLYEEKALEIRERNLPCNHPDRAQSYNNIGSVYDKMGEYSKALSFQEKALEIRQKTLPDDHPDLGESYNNIASVYNKMKAYSKALSFCERAVDIGQTSLPPNHPDLQLWEKTLELVKKNCK